MALNMYLAFLLLGVQSVAFTSYFENITTHDTNLVYCDKHQSGVVFKLPNEPVCDLPELNNSTAINITTYWPHEGDHKFLGKECYAEKYTKAVGETFFGLYEPLQSVSTIKMDKITKKECLGMVVSGATPKGEKLKSLGPGMVGTDNHVTPEAGWLLPSSAENTNYFIVDIRMTVSSEHHLIRTIGTLTEKDCKVDEEFCQTNRGSLIWKKSDHRTCRIMLGKSTTCLKTASHITCPETMNSIIGYEPVEMCGVQVARANTGVLFSSGVDMELHPNISSNENVLKEIKRIHENRVDLTDLQDKGHPTTTQSLMMNQFIVSTINSRLESAIFDFHYSLCLNNKMMLKLHLDEAKRGDVTGLVNALRGDGSYTGQLSGDLVSVIKCYDIYNYTFKNVLDSDLCTLEKFLTYEFNREVRNGYLRPITHEIIDIPTLVECPSLPFLFVTKNGSVLNLETKLEVHDVPTLFNPGQSVKGERLPEVVFTPEVIWVGGENFSNPTEDDLQALNNIILIGRMIEMAKHGQAPKGTGWDLLKSILAWIAGGIVFYVVIGLIIVAFIILVLVKPSFVEMLIKVAGGIIKGGVSFVYNLSYNGIKLVRNTVYAAAVWVWNRVTNRSNRKSFVIIKQNPAWDVENNKKYLQSLPRYVQQKRE